MSSRASRHAKSPIGKSAKRMAAIILTVLLTVALAACGQLPPDEGPEEPSARWNEATWDVDRWN